MSPALPPDHSPEALPPAARRALVAATFALHLAAGWALLQIEPVRRAAREVLPIVVDWIVPPAPVPVPPPPPRPQPVVLPKPAVVAAPPMPQAPAPVFVAPPPPEAPAPEPAPEVFVAAAPTSPPPAPAAPPEPRVIAITAVEDLTPPVLTYPPAARRAQEEGRVEVRVLVDARGAPAQWRGIRPPRPARLDDAAPAPPPAPPLQPYTEDGVPQPFWVVMPLVFELES